MTSLHRVILGDNQFFGINHMSEEKAQQQSERFRDNSSIIEAIDYAYQCGVRALMLTTHERAAGICDYFRENARRYPDLAFRSEERRVGKEGRCRWSPEHSHSNITTYK